MGQAIHCLVAPHAAVSIVPGQLKRGLDKTGNMRIVLHNEDLSHVCIPSILHLFIIPYHTLDACSRM